MEESSRSKRVTELFIGKVCGLGFKRINMIIPSIAILRGKSAGTDDRLDP